MEILQRAVLIPENQSYLLSEVELKNNRGVIHTHDSYELNFIIDAYGKRFVAGNISNFIPGDLLFMAPGVAHCWEIDNKEIDPRAYTIHFKKDFFETALSSIKELEFITSLINKSKQGLFIKGVDSQMLLLLYKELFNTESSLDKIIKILKILRLIVSSNDIQLLANQEFTWDADLPQNQRIKKVYEYVFFNFSKDIRLIEIASLIGLSEGAFCAFFKKNTKKTFFEFIKEVRISYACKLLNADKDQPISSICFECGYNNFANFNRQFKEVTNVSPKQYRKKSELETIYM